MRRLFIRKVLVEPTISLLYMKLMNLLRWGKFNGNWKLNSAFPCTSNIHMEFTQLYLQFLQFYFSFESMRDYL